MKRKLKKTFKKDAASILATPESIEEIIRVHIQPRYPDIDFSITPSKSTSSIYVRCSMKSDPRWSVTIRFADHPTKQNLKTVMTPTLQVTWLGKLKIKDVRRPIINSIWSLRRAHVYHTINKISQGEKSYVSSDIREKRENSSTQNEDSTTKD